MGDKRMGPPDETVNVEHEDANPRFLYVFLGIIICVLVVTTALSVYHRNITLHNSPESESSVTARAERALDENPEAENALNQLGYTGDSAQELVEWSILHDSIAHLRAVLDNCESNVAHLLEQQEENQQ